MAQETPPPRPLVFKPDLDEANQRWEAYWAGDIIDRPIVYAAVRRPGFEYAAADDYWERVYGDLDDIMDRALHNAAGTDYCAEAVPQFWLSFGPDEMAAYCGAELRWSATDANTNWSVPFVENWEDSLPLQLQADSPLWQRMLRFYRRAAGRLGGKMLLRPLDFHTNLDLLAAIRGPERLCMDLMDVPETIDRAMANARGFAREVWNAIRRAGRFDEFGYAYWAYSMEGVRSLCCDFSAMIGPKMFRRWVKPALEEEASCVKHCIYHWDGPRALVHFDEIMSMAYVHTVWFVPDPGEADIQYLNLLKRIQARGKAVAVQGNIEQIKQMHLELNPAKVMYVPRVETRAEVEGLLEWLVRHT